MKWFSSDWHLSHEAVIKMSSRPFSSVEEMDKTIVKNMLSEMSKGDNLYILGDISMKREPALKALKEIKESGIHIHIITGNHDVKWINQDVAKLTKSIELQKIVTLSKGERVHLSHFPLLVWSNSFRNSWHLHGHVHLGSVDYLYVAENMRGKCLNVNVEMNKYQPWSEDDIREYMEGRDDNEDYKLLKKQKSGKVKSYIEARKALERENEKKLFNEIL